MNTDQSATVIRDAIRQAARECGVKPSEAHVPDQQSKAGVTARNLAMADAYRQGIDIDTLATAFRRKENTIRGILRQTLA